MPEYYSINCPICLNVPKKDTVIIVTPCEHFICMNCLIVGGYNIRSCPMCRGELREAYGYKNREKIFTLDEVTCPHCIAKDYADNNHDSDNLENES